MRRRAGGEGALGEVRVQCRARRTGATQGRLGGDPAPRRRADGDGGTTRGRSALAQTLEAAPAAHCAGDGKCFCQPTQFLRRTAWSRETGAAGRAGAAEPGARGGEGVGTRGALRRPGQRAPPPSGPSVLQALPRVCAIRRALRVTGVGFVPRPRAAARGARAGAPAKASGGPGRSPRRARKTAHTNRRRLRGLEPRRKTSGGARARCSRRSSRRPPCGARGRPRRPPSSPASRPARATNRE